MYIAIMIVLFLFIMILLLKLLRPSAPYYEGWKTGDKVNLYTRYMKKSFEKDEDNRCTLIAWDSDYVYLRTKDGGASKIDKSVISLNYSKLWRDNSVACTHAMGTQVQFNTGNKDDSPRKVPIEEVKEIVKDENKKKVSFDKFTGGKNIDELTLEECRVFLNKAISYNFPLFQDAIRKRIKKLAENGNSN